MSTIDREGIFRPREQHILQCGGLEWHVINVRGLEVAQYLWSVEGGRGLRIRVEELLGVALLPPRGSFCYCRERVF